MDSLDVGMAWLEQRWEADVIAHYKGPIRHKPTNKVYDLHFNCPVCWAPVRHPSAVAHVDYTSCMSLAVGTVWPLLAALEG